MRGKRGIEFNFSLIFSIILIAVILAVAFYGIRVFLGVKDCANAGLFYDELQSEVDRGWRSDVYKNDFELRVPDGIQSVCFGDLAGESSGREYEVLRDFEGVDANVFVYPPDEACKNFEYKQIDHLEFGFTGLECYRVESGRINIALEKGSFDDQVKLNVE